MSTLRAAALTSLCVLAACAEGTGYTSTGDELGASQGTGSESGAGDGDGDASSSPSDSEAPPDTLPEQELVDIGHQREFRGVWVTTVYNINWPSAQGLDASAAEAELLEIIEACEAINLNAIVFQIRPESDAVYASQLEPWSRYLSGAQGGDPGFDPLEFLITQAHARNIEVHGWVNPYRAAASAATMLAQPHIALQQPEHAHVYNGSLWMDPGAMAVREHVVDVILDVVDRYELDGVHLDDYFYPYPAEGLDFPDELSWQAYLDGGGMLELADWRRDNVNGLVEELHDAIASADPDLRFGISPFGIYRPGIPEGIVGFDQYAQLYADPLLWLEQGWVDYLAPQLYWPTTYTQQDYEVLLDWWSQQSTSRYIFAGNYLSQLGTAPEWSLDEILLQVELSRLYREQKSMGNIFFQVQPLLADTLGVNAALYEEFYAEPALTPPLSERLGELVSPPLVTLEDGQVLVEDLADQRLRAWTIYVDEGGAWQLDRIVPADPSGSDVLELDTGRWAVAAVAWHNGESPGVLIEI